MPASERSLHCFHVGMLRIVAWYVEQSASIAVLVSEVMAVTS